MNAVNPVQTSPLPSADAEPSMEEILASIRRIIADDSSLPHTPDARDHEAEGAPSTRDIAADTGHAQAPEVTNAAPPLEGAVGTVPPHLPAIDPDATPAEAGASAGLSQSTSSEGPMVESISHLPPHPLAPDLAGRAVAELEAEVTAPHDPIQSNHVPPQAEAPPAVPPSEPERLFSAATDSSVAAAFNALAASRFVASSEQLTGLVREMIRPLVKEWVDANLPGMVERIVVAEIERIARGGH